MAATLVQVQELAGSGNTYFEDAEVNLSGQPADTSMAWRIVPEYGDPDVRVSGTLLQWNGGMGA